MADSYKGIAKLNTFVGGQYPPWKRLTLGYFNQHCPRTFTVLTTPSDDEIAAMPAAEAVAARAAAAATAAERAKHDGIAGADVLKFLGPEMTRLHVRTESGKQIWDDIARDFRDWTATQAPVLQQQLRDLGPRADEGVAAYCDRAILLAADLRDVGRTLNDAYLVDAVLAGLVRERPAWSPVLLGLRGALSGQETLRQLRGRLAEVESRDAAELAPGAHGAHAVAAAAAAANPSAHDRRLEAIEAQLRRLMSQPSTSGAPQRAPRACYRCGSAKHQVKDCPHPPVGSGMPSPPACSSAGSMHLPGSSWVLDSGCSQHMSPGEGGGGTGGFDRYRVLHPPQQVRFGKRGSVANAVGVGDMTVWGPQGAVVLSNVLHVPELAGPLFSVSSALNDGASVHFDPPAQRGGAHRVLLVHAGRVLLTASHKGGLYFLDAPHHVHAAVAHDCALEQAWQWHRRLGHLGFSTLADLARLGLLGRCDVTPAQFLQARDLHVCEPCVVGKLRRTSHPPRVPRPVRVLHRVHMDVCELPGCPDRYFSSVIDEATRYARVVLQQRKSETAAAVRTTIIWCETQTDRRVQRVRHDNGGEYVVRELAAFYAERGIQSEPTAPYSPEANGLAERHNLVLLDIALPMLADSGDARHGLPALGPQHAGDAVLYANDLHNATPSSGAQVGRTPHEGFFQRAIALSAFRRFGCRVWVHSPGKPHKHRSKLAPRGQPGRFLGFVHPLGSGVYRVLLDTGKETRSQTVVFDEAPFSPAPVLLPPVPAAPVPAPPGGGDDSDDDDDDVNVHGEGPGELPAVGEQGAVEEEPPLGELPAAGEPQPDAHGVGEPALAQPPAPAPPAVEAPAVPAPQAPAQPQRPARATRNPAPQYADYPMRRGANARTAAGPRRVHWAPDVIDNEKVSAARSGEPPLAATQPTADEAQQRRRRRKPGTRKRRRAALKPVVSRPFFPTRTGGTCRGVYERLSKPQSRRGMQPLPDKPAFAGAAWAGVAASYADMQARAMAASAAQSVPRDPDPRSVAEALSRPDAAEWQRAIDEELASCMEYEVWEEVDLPPGKQALPSRMVLERKRDGRYKARLVAGGHKQQQGLDFDETYAPVCGLRTLRMVIAVAAHEKLEMRQFDIRTAFLNGELAEEVYIRAPAGAPGLANQGRVLRLRRALYGLRQAGRAWNKRLEAELRAKGFTQSTADPSLWILRSESGAVLAMFYVDDGFVAARTAAEADALVDLVGSMFAIRKLGEPTDFLGIEISRDREAGTITIDQERKATALAEAAGVAGERRKVPMSPDTYAQLRAAQPGDAMAEPLEYQSILGSLLHLAQCTRPDIALAVGALASYSSAPTQQHREALLDVVRYVGSTAERGITYGHTTTPIETWCDANFAACLDTRRSTTGWVVVMYGGAVSWSCKKQPTTAVSTMDAEYQACGAVAREGLSVLKALDELALLCADFPIVGPLSIYCDNKAAISLCKDRKEGQRVKHIDIIHHFARDHVASGELQFVYCKSADNVSDCLTKALARPVFEVCLVGLGMLRV